MVRVRGLPPTPEQRARRKSQPLYKKTVRNVMKGATSKRKTYGCCVRPRSWVEDSQERVREVEPL